MRGTAQDQTRIRISTNPPTREEDERESERANNGSDTNDDGGMVCSILCRWTHEN